MAGHIHLRACTCMIILTPYHNKSACKESRVDSPGLVDFSIGLENSVLNLPDGQVRIFRRSKITEVL